MQTNYAKHVTSGDSQREKAKPEQIENNAGGFVFEIDPMKQLDRFLILGSEGNTYYCSENKMSKDNAKNIIKLLDEDPIKVLKRTIEISVSGRAYKNNPALFVMALGITHGDLNVKDFVVKNIPLVARTFTHLIIFITYAKEMRGWGRSLRRAVTEWYNKDVNQLVYQYTKYGNREGWKHKDVILCGHIKPVNNEISTFFKYVMGKVDINTIEGFEYLKKVEEIKKLDVSFFNIKKVIKLINENKFPFEVVPTPFLKEASVWEALLPNLGLIALIRNLGRLTSNGLIAPNCKHLNYIVDRILEENEITKSKIHPIQYIAALVTYESGHSARGKTEWKPVRQIIDALNDGVYKSFKNIIPSEKRFMLGLDVSGSMVDGVICGVPGLTPAHGTAIMAMITAKVEKMCYTFAFANTFKDLSISPKMSFNDIMERISGINFGSTDCALPMIYALENKIPVDVFCIYTDNETYYGKIHPFQALKEYRRKMNIPAKLIICGMTSTNFSIADPSDCGMMDVVGFDANTPSMISDFAGERI